MVRRIAFVVTLFAVGVLGAAVPGHASPGGGGCNLQGTANFKTGLTSTTPVNFKYSFSGTLGSAQTPCMADPSQGTVPSTGAVSAGIILKHAGKRYQEPVPSGNGSCASGTTDGISVIQWADKTATVVSYHTQ